MRIFGLHIMTERHSFLRSQALAATIDAAHDLYKDDRERAAEKIALAKRLMGESIEPYRWAKSRAPHSSRKEPPPAPYMMMADGQIVHKVTGEVLNG